MTYYKNLSLTTEYIATTIRSSSEVVSSVNLKVVYGVCANILSVDIIFTGSLDWDWQGHLCGFDD